MNILYEDNHIIVAVKPQNVPAQADSSGDPDFLSQVKEYVRVKYNKPGAAYIGLVHRLDRPAGGLMVFARTSKAAARLSQQMRTGGIEKKYLAVVEGDLPSSGDMEDWLAKDSQTNTSYVTEADEPGAKCARLTYRVLGRKENLSLVEVHLQTGRPHQIRVQFSSRGVPLMGDVRYGGTKNENLCLWAHTLAFTHPTLKEPMRFTAPPPAVWPWALFTIEDEHTQSS